MNKFIFKQEKIGFKLFKNLHNCKKNTNTSLASIQPQVFQIIIFEKAKGSLELNGRITDVKDKSVFFIAPFQKTNYLIDTSKSKGFHLVFHEQFFSTVFNDKLFAYRIHYFYNSQHLQFLHLSSKDFEFIKVLLNELDSESTNDNSDSKQILKSLLHFVLMKLNRLYSEQYNLPSETQGDELIYKFKEALERNIRKFHLVDDYCDILSIQRHKLNRIIKTHFGVTVKETIHFRLLQEIKLELIYSDKTIAEIAKELNFSEPNNLTRFFNRLESIPPTLFKEKHQIDR